MNSPATMVNGSVPLPSEESSKKKVEQHIHIEKDMMEEPPEPHYPNIQTEHFQQTVNTIRNLHLLNDFYDLYQLITPVFLPDPSEEVRTNWAGGLSMNPKTLFIDIDETMVHCIDERDPPTMKGQQVLKVKLKSETTPPSLVGLLSSKNKPEYIEIKINIRPGLISCLLELRRLYQLVAFTASDQAYADTILDFIDPDNDIFSARLYRQHCVDTNYGLIKDLRIIGNRTLKEMIIIDNSALSFAFNVNNGIPILPFYDNTGDEELRHLTFYLKCLQESRADDIRYHN